MENSPKYSKKLVFIGSIFGCAFVVLCCILITVLGIGGFALYGFQSPEGVVINLEVPTEVFLGEEFDILVEIENVQADPQNLIAISFLMDFLDGVDIVDSDPTFIYQDGLEIMEIPMQVFTYSEMILEGELLEIRITAVPIQIGDFGGEIQICLNSPTNCERISVHTSVFDN